VTRVDLPLAAAGRSAVSSLAGAGLEVSALVRDPGRASLPEGVEVVRGDLSSPQTLEPALRDVESVYLMWPGIAVEPRVVEAIAEHARHVVYLSTDVADLADGEQATSFHQEIERLIRKSGLSWTFLRAIDFATNTLAWADQVKQGVMRWSYGQASRSLIHERDIADVAVHVLTSAQNHVQGPTQRAAMSVTVRERKIPKPGGSGKVRSLGIPTGTATVAGRTRTGGRGLHPASTSSSPKPPGSR
jgi:uncharacterized protein YbjT (DUF2867 family)